ncbi:MAG: hypothetical protein JWO36_4370 [Myxococcales bacterium]|nr:hypothetical protein [Myxococcales bacterium]
MRRGIAAEYTEKDALLSAIRVMRSCGFTKLEAFSPYPVHEIDEALGARRSPLAVAAAIGAAAGAFGAYALQWWLVAYLYPVDVGQRPPHMPLAFVIITVEMGFLFGGLTVFFTFLIASRLFRLWDPLFEIEGFASATRASFWLALDANDPLWDRDAVENYLHGTGPARVRAFGGLG